jgi:TPR repeat protein
MTMTVKNEALGTLPTALATALAKAPATALAILVDAPGKARALMVVCALAVAPTLPAMAQQADNAPVNEDPALVDKTLIDMAEIERAWARNDFVTVRTGLKRLAEETGTPLAQYRYGRVLIEGKGGPQDPAGAVLWLGKAVEQNHAEAATLLARIYLSNVTGGPARDPAKAAELLKRAATRGEAQAQYLLGLLYQNGSGVEQDLETALNWFLAAAEQQNIEAQFALSGLYLNGTEATRNIDEGMRWLRTAAAEGNVEAQVQLALLLDDAANPGVKRREALDWYRRAAELGHPVAQRNLGTRYLQGDGVDPDPQEAFRWLRLAAKAGDSGAMNNLGFAFASGTGTAQDMEQAVQWYGAAAQSGLGRAMVALAQMHERGSGTIQDFDKALFWYLRALDTRDARTAAIELGRATVEGKLDGQIAPQRSVPWVVVAAQADQPGALDWLQAQAAQGEHRAQSALGRLLFATAPDRRAEAVDLLRAAADDGDGPALYALAGILVRGDHGAAPDYVEAHKWYNIAATLGHPDAPAQREILGNLMTPEQIATAQAAARDWFEADALKTPGLGGD